MLLPLAKRPAVDAKPLPRSTAIRGEVSGGEVALWWRGLVLKQSKRIFRVARSLLAGRQSGFFQENVELWRHIQVIPGVS